MGRNTLVHKMHSAIVMPSKYSKLTISSFTLNLKEFPLELTSDVSKPVHTVLNPQPGSHENYILQNNQKQLQCIEHKENCGISNLNMF